MAAKTEESDKKMWIRRGKLTFYGIIIAGIGFLIGLYIIAPMQAKSESYVPKAVKKMQPAVVEFTNPDGKKVLIPLKIADEDKERDQGLNKVGKEALYSTYLLYDQEDVSTWSEDYDVSNIKATLSLAVINGDGKVVSIKEATVKDDEIETEKDHRWVLAMKKDIMKGYGIKVGTKLMTNTLPGAE
ncbi:MAG: DUF192 domain-containing protein [Candidatus Bipolaricaulia bacterium]